MNRATLTNFQTPLPAQLPPETRAGPLRILFVHSNLLGFATQTRQIKTYAARRDDIDAVHLDLLRPLWGKIIGKTLPLPRGMDRAPWRLAWVYRRLLGRWLNQPILRGRFDVVHVTTQGVAAAILDCKSNLAAKWSLYADLTARSSVRDFGGSPRAMASFAHLEEQMFAAADLLMGMNQLTVDSMIRDYSIAPEKVFLSRGCVPVVDHRAARPHGRVPRILFVANNWKPKGGPDLLRLHQRKFARQCQLHIVGRNIPVDNTAYNVIWHGPTPHEKLLAEIYPASDILVLPTRMDVSPWVLIEAASNGLPVIATRVGAIGEIVRDQQTGILIDRGDWSKLEAALRTLLNDPQLRQSMGEAALIHMRQNFDPDKIYNTLLDRLHGLAGDRPTNPATLSPPAPAMDSPAPPAVLPR